MKTGILLLVHNHLDEVRRLVDSLKATFDVFIHIDAKSDIPSDIFSAENNIHTIKQFPIHWGNIEMTLATLALLRMAYQQSCDYCLLISGADLPVRPAGVIAAEIAENPDTNYVDCAPLPRADFPLNGGMERLTLFWETGFQNKKNLRHTLCAIFRTFQRLTGFKRKPVPMKYYAGGQWFNFSREVVKFILDFTDNNPRFLKQFKHMRNADEIYFLTIAMNSPYAPKIITDNDKRYIDWTSGPEFPKILRTEDYHKITASDAFFARKFDPDTDPQIIRKMRTR
jgi:hypothetical protein